jgi:hypothetical protein
MTHPLGEAPGRGGDVARTQRHAGAPGVLLRSALWLLLGGWVGSWACFGMLVAPLAFQLLPSTRIAGSLVGPILNALHLYGAAAGGILALLAWRLERGRLLVGLPLLLTAACLYTHFGVSAEMAEISGQAFGPEGSEVLSARFNELHRRSLAIFLAVSAATLALVFLHARADTPAAGGSTPVSGRSVGSPG